MVRREAGLKRLASLLEELRSLDGLGEKRPGTFSYRSRAFLHFHYHPRGEIVADARVSGDGFTRFDVSEEAGRQELLAEIKRFLAC
jgi:hypothetical protein